MLLFLRTKLVRESSSRGELFHFPKEFFNYMSNRAQRRAAERASHQTATPAAAP